MDKQQIIPKGNGAGIRRMFDAIAPSYDLLNRIISMGLDRSWRQETVRRVAIEKPMHILDLASGTGDLAIDLAKTLPEATIVAADLSTEMLQIGQKKAAQQGVQHAILPTPCDALAMPFKNNSFDAVTCAFGVRNFYNLPDALQEMKRVLTPGGLLAVLELCEPIGWVRPFYKAHAFHIIPFVGKVVGHNKKAYQYLPKSIERVAQRETFTNMLKQQGWERVTYRTFTPGVCALYIAYKPL